MASTGEVASFGKDVHEAYWAALLSVNGFKLPRPHSGILLGGDINRPEMAVVAAGLMRLGFHLYTHCECTFSAHLRAFPISVLIRLLAWSITSSSPHTLSMAR